MVTPERLDELLAKLPALEARLADPETASDPKRYREVLQEHTRLSRIRTAYRRVCTLRSDAASARELLTDPELADAAQEELTLLEPQLAEAEERLLHALLPPDPLDERPALVEIRAGTGGDEAALFAADLFRMYQRYCETAGYSLAVMSASPSDLGGYKEIIFVISGGEQPYGRFRFESGGHRVQRIPQTETQGRIHTSAATVIVLPQATEEDTLTLAQSELRIDIFCAGGHGGQGVNTTYSAVRITHLPTGIAAQCQDERSQHRNKEKALAVLTARLLDHRRQQAEAEAGATRLTLRGSGDRSQRIRTYNFPQNRLTDHRINLTLYALERIIAGDLEPLFSALQSCDLHQRLEAESH